MDHYEKSCLKLSRMYRITLLLTGWTDQDLICWNSLQIHLSNKHLKLFTVSHDDFIDGNLAWINNHLVVWLYKSWNGYKFQTLIGTLEIVICQSEYWHLQPSCHRYLHEADLHMNLKFNMAVRQDLVLPESRDICLVLLGVILLN